jgi:hypothetical protein
LCSLLLTARTSPGKPRIRPPGCQLIRNFELTEIPVVSRRVARRNLAVPQDVVIAHSVNEPVEGRSLGSESSTCWTAHRCGRLRWCGALVPRAPVVWVLALERLGAFAFARTPLLLLEAALVALPLLVVPRALLGPVALPFSLAIARARSFSPITLLALPLAIWRLRPLTPALLAIAVSTRLVPLLLSPVAATFLALVVAT